MLLQRAPPATPHVAVGFCQGHREVTPQSFCLSVVVNVLYLCDLFELGSEVWFCVFACVVYCVVFVMFKFNVVVVDLVVTYCDCLYDLCLWFVCVCFSKC